MSTSVSPDTPSSTETLFAVFRDRRCATAFRGLVENYGGLVRGTASRVLGNAESARDVEQAVFADLARMAPRLPERIALGGWLHRHTVFLSLRQLRSDRRRGAREDEAQRRWNLESGPDGTVPWLGSLDEALDRLGDADRQAIALRYFENLPLRAVGEALGSGEDAAQKRIARALEKLRGLLVRRGFSGVSAAALGTAAAGMPGSAAGASGLAAAALRAASASSLPSAGVWTTFLAMNLKPIIIGAASAAVLACSVMAPIIVSQRKTIADLEGRLQSPPAPAPASKPKLSAAERAGAANAAKNTRRSEYEVFQERYAPVKDRVEAWAKAVMQIEDSAMKQAALDEMVAAMSSSEGEDVFAALSAYERVGTVEFDRSLFRPAIVALLGNSDAVIRRMALAKVAGLPPDEGDIARVTALAGDSDFGVRKVVVSSLFWLTKGDLTGDAGATVLSILNEAETPSRSLVDTMWGARFSPELEQKMVDFARAPSRPDDEELAYYAVYSCLSTQNNKGPACVDLLIERLAHADSYNVGGRAAWGLGYGVQPGLGLEKKIADASLKIWKNRSDAYLRKEVLGCLGKYGDASHAAALEETSAAPAMGEEERAQLLELAGKLRQRAAE